MKTSLFALVASFALAIVVWAGVQQSSSKSMVVPASYQSLWKQVDSLQEKSLSQSAQLKLNTLYTLSMQTQDYPQLIKVLLYQLKLTSDTDNDRLPERIKEVEQAMQAASDSSVKAMLGSILAQIYSKQYQSEAYLIASRTNLSDQYIPEDSREWTSNTYETVIYRLLQESINWAQIQPDSKLEVYKTILLEGKSTEQLYTDVYDFVLKQAIETAKMMSSVNAGIGTNNTLQYLGSLSEFLDEKIETNQRIHTNYVLSLYQKLLSYKQAKKQDNAVLLLDLERLAYAHQLSTHELKSVHYIAALTQLEAVYKKNPIVIEVLYNQAQFYYNNRSAIVPLPSADKATAYAVFLPEEDEAQKEQSLKQRQQVYQICQKGIEQFPEYERIGLVKNLLAELTYPKLDIAYGGHLYPGDSLKINLTYRQLKGCVVEIYQINEPATAYVYAWDRQGLYSLPSSQKIASYSAPLKASLPYADSKKTLYLPPLKEGLYELVVYTAKDTVTIRNGSLLVSAVHSAVRLHGGRSLDIWVSDYKSGQALVDYQVLFFKKAKNKYTQLAKYTPGKKELFSTPYPKEATHYQIISKNKGITLVQTLPYAYSTSYRTDGEQEQEKVQLFTDRSLYRPGQIVQFKLIATQYKQGLSSVLPNKKYTVKLRDAQGNHIKKETFTSNNFGSFSGSMSLPSQGLNGAYYLEVEGTSYASSQILVEEYKRPTFVVQFDTIAQTYRVGDKIHITGKVQTYSGVLLQNTPLEYSIEKRFRWLRSYPPQSNQSLEAGTLTTNTKGEFSIEFVAQADVVDLYRKYFFTEYQVQVVAVSESGERQESTIYIPLSSHSLRLQLDADDKIDKDKIKPFTVTAFNASGKELTASGRYTLYQLNDTNKLSGNSTQPLYRLGPALRQGEFASQTPFTIQDLDKLSSGAYRLALSCLDNQQREVEQQVDFILHSLQDKSPATTTYTWVPTRQFTAQVGETTPIYFGSSAKQVQVLEDVFYQGKLLNSKRFTLSNSIQQRKIRLEKHQTEGVQVVYTLVKDGRLFSETITIAPPVQKTELVLSTQVFRDKLQPGQEEEWTIKVSNPQNALLLAEVLAGMYDASLDQLHPHAWFFSPFNKQPYWSVPYYSANPIEDLRQSISFAQSTTHVPVFSYHQLNWFGWNPYRSRWALRGGTAYLSSSPALQEAVMQKSAGTQQTESDNRYQADQTETVPTLTETKTETTLLRQNRNETAFFYPHLLSNEQGEVFIKFKVPESNTRWKLMLLAHSQDGSYGQLVKEVVSQKPLMVQPNFPRFLREGDTASIRVRVSNLSSSEQTGILSLTFFDPETEQTINDLALKPLRFTLPATESAGFSWEIKVPSHKSLLACKILAQTDSGLGDGEQQLLPVLSNKTLVTETLSLNNTKQGTSRYVFDSFIQKADKVQHYAYTFEVNGNPAWLAIQALPSLTSPKTDNTVSWFTSFYSNSLATQLAGLPVVKKNILLWNKAATATEPLLATMEKNAELKDLLLEETPWLLEVKNETQQLQHLQEYLDENKSAYLKQQAINQLLALQNEDGGWPWYTGMKSNLDISTWILNGLAQLKEAQLLTKDERIAEMEKKAIDYLDYECAERFLRLKKYNKQWRASKTLSKTEIEYLYLRAKYRQYPNTANQEAVDFYLSVLDTYWTSQANLYLKALTALILHQNGYKTTPSSILQSLKEYAKMDSSMGMYWPNNKQQSFFAESALVVHRYLMEAFALIQADSSTEMEALRLWLLKQKQTQVWESSVATIEAIYALLDKGKPQSWITQEVSSVLTLGDQTLDFSSAGTGMAYYKKTFAPEQIQSKLGQITWQKNNSAPAWGAAYWQYFIDSDQVEQAKTGLQLDKNLFVERKTANGSQLYPLDNTSTVQVGDKLVVRLTLRSDRAYQYLYLKDSHAGGLESINQLSGTQWKENLYYRQVPKDASTLFYLEYVPIGTYVLEYSVYASLPGNYSLGSARVQSMYAPEFQAHTKGSRITIVP